MVLKMKPSLKPNEHKFSKLTECQTEPFLLYPDPQVVSTRRFLLSPQVPFSLCSCLKVIIFLLINIFHAR